MDYDSLEDWEEAEREYEQMCLEEEAEPVRRRWEDVRPNPRYL